MEVSQKNKNRTTLLPSNFTPTPGHITEKNKQTLIQKHTCTSVFTVALYTTAKIWRQPNCPSTDEWIKKMVCVCVSHPHTHTHTHTHTHRQWDTTKP